MNEQFWERLRGMNKDKFGLAILERALKNERKYLKSLRRIACRSVSTFKFQTYVVYFYHQAWSKTSYLQEYRLTVENSLLQNHEQSIIPFNVRALNSRNKSKLVNLIRERTLVARQWGKKKKIYIYIHANAYIIRGTKLNAQKVLTERGIIKATNIFIRNEMLIALFLQPWMVNNFN